MKLYLIRHGETDVNRILGHGVSGPMHDEPVAFKQGGNTNIGLNVYGRAHAYEAGTNLPDSLDAMYASPLLRTKETAEVIAEMKGIDPSQIEMRDELIEYYQGSLDGYSLEQSKEIAGGQTWGSGLHCNYDYTPWGDDSWKTIYDRLSKLLVLLKERHTDQTVVCVTSSGVIRMAYKIFFADKAPGITKYMLIKNGSVHEFIL